MLNKDRECKVLSLVSPGPVRTLKGVRMAALQLPGPLAGPLCANNDGEMDRMFHTAGQHYSTSSASYISLSRSNAPPHTKITTAAIIHNIKQCITPNVPFPPSKRTKAALHARALRPATPINPSRHAIPADRRRCALMLGKPYTTRTKCPGRHQRQKRELRVHAPRP